MKINKPLLITIAIWIAAAAFLFSGAEILTSKLLFIHVGTLLAWIALASFAYFSYLIVKSNPQMKIVQSIVLALALIWFVVSFLLAGNTDIIFSYTSIWKVWIFYTAFIVAVSSFTVLFFVLNLLFRKKETGL